MTTLMGARSTTGQPGEFDWSAAQAAWIRSLPDEVRGSLLSARDVTRLLHHAREFLRTRSPRVVVELESEVYRLAGPLEQAIGQDGALRLLRDGMVAALLPCIRSDPGCAEAAERVISRVTDAVWRAHTDALQATLRSRDLERFRQELTIAK